LAPPAEIDGHHALAAGLEHGLIGQLQCQVQAPCDLVSDFPCDHFCLLHARIRQRTVQNERPLGPDGIAGLGRPDAEPHTWSRLPASTGDRWRRRVNLEPGVAAVDDLRDSGTALKLHADCTVAGPAPEAWVRGALACAIHRSLDEQIRAPVEA